MANDLVDKYGSTFRAGACVFRENDAGDEMYIIHQGEVRISKKARNAEQVLAILKDGDFFGEMAIFTDQSRSATATVTKPSVILKIDRLAFHYMIKSNTVFSVNMIRKLCERLRKADNQIKELLTLSKETRIIKAMAQYWPVAGQKDLSGQNLLLPYEGFLEFLQRTQGIELQDAKSHLLALKNQDMVHIRKDQSGHHYIAFSPKVFEYIDVVL